MAILFHRSVVRNCRANITVAVSSDSGGRMSRDDAYGVRERKRAPKATNFERPRGVRGGEGNFGRHRPSIPYVIHGGGEGRVEENRNSETRRNRRRGS